MSMSNNQWGNPGPPGGYGQGPGPMGPPGPGPQGPGPAGPQGPGFPAYAGAPAPRPNKKATPIALIAIITVVAVLGAIVGFALWIARDTPQKGVDRYFEALNSPYSNNLADVVVNVPSAVELKEAKTMAASQRGKYAVKDVSISGDSAKVDYTIDGRTEQTELKLRKVDGKYKVVDGFSKLTLNSPSGVALALGYSSDDLTGKTIPLYPGTYEVRGASGTVSSAYWEFKDPSVKAVTLKPGESKTLEVAIQLNDRGAERVRQVVGSAFLKCTSNRAPNPEGCPFSVPAPTDVGSSARWRVGADGSSAYEVADKAQVDRSQPLNAVCVNFNAQVGYEYYTPDYRDKRSVRAPQEKFTGCADLSQSRSDASVTWK